MSPVVSVVLVAVGGALLCCSSARYTQMGHARGDRGRMLDMKRAGPVTCHRRSLLRYSPPHSIPNTRCPKSLTILPLLIQLRS